MGLKEDLGFSRPIEKRAHEAALSVVVTGEMLRKEATRVLRRFGLTGAQYNVLSLLRYQSADGSLNQTRLGRMLVVNRSNVTGLIDRMEEAGWVSRSARAKDRRVKQVALTAEGRKLQERAEVAYEGRLTEVMADLSDAKCRALCGMLEKARARLRGVGSARR